MRTYKKFIKLNILKVVKIRKIPKDWQRSMGMLQAVCNCYGMV